MAKEFHIFAHFTIHQKLSILSWIFFKSQNLIKSLKFYYQNILKLKVAF
jgi:hypothetical protein